MDTDPLIGMLSIGHQLTYNVDLTWYYGRVC